MAPIASARASVFPVRAGGLYMRVYSVDRNGLRTELPVVEPTRVGACGIIGCTCMEPGR